MILPSINLNSEKLSRFEEAIKQEWIITNGLGGYASSTVLGINTRKYHGLLVAAFHPPGDRRVCVAKVNEELSIGSQIYPLGADEFQNGIFPKGYLFLKEFSISPFPKHVYIVQNVKVQKMLFMPQGKNAVLIFYRVLNGSGLDVKIRVFPLINCRHMHSVTDRWKIFGEFKQKQEDKEVEMRFNNPQTVILMKITNGHYYAAEKWIEKVFYREEAMRGETCIEDCFQQGYVEVEVKAGAKKSFAIIFVASEKEVDAQRSLEGMPSSVYDVEALYEREVVRRENFLAKFYEEHMGVQEKDWLNWILLETDMFIVKGISDLDRAVIAGYHWFETWGRDTFISLPGLMLVTGRFEDARKTFLTFQKHCRDGLIPNFLPEHSKEPVYNTVDATLWFINAIWQYLKYTSDFKFVQEQLWSTLKLIMENHIKGTIFGIRLDADGLLAHNSQLTWMDAVVDGQPVTPRGGKAVEVQALWYNALRIMETLANKFKEKGETEKFAQIAEKAKKSFVEKFWNAEKNYMFDVVGENEKDSSLRPNQIIAVALDFTMLDKIKSEKIVDVVQRELLTPYGLRTLARNDPKYVGVYSGDRRSRDKVYHNGTVWPWLLGPFTKAYLKTKGYTDFRREYALKNFLLPLFTHQPFRAGLGAISEIFDGDPPHMSRGCIAQAWSIAEPLRAYIEDIMQIRPKYEREIMQASS
ncbi:MAG: amylo-alpha-1,6-glucosidase [Candidatus Bathyarchaeota archaeon]|nr:amylo-alpha-1,6-glucosidase [Candidatus Bathyarchaeota archaeon]